MSMETDEPVTVTASGPSGIDKGKGPQVVEAVYELPWFVSLPSRYHPSY